MQIRAENDPRYWRKFLIMGICALGFALYCLYDGAIGYPARRAKGFAEFKQDFKSHFKDEKQLQLSLAELEATVGDEQRLEWDHYAHDRDIPSKYDVYVQFIMAAAMIVAGLLLVSNPLRARGRWIEFGPTGLSSSWGESFGPEQVQLIDKRKWKGKGIAKVRYLAGNKRGMFVVDDYKFDRYRTDAILYLLEQRVDPEKIVNGPPEPEPEGKVAEILGGTAATA